MEVHDSDVDSWGLLRDLVLGGGFQALVGGAGGHLQSDVDSIYYHFGLCDFKRAADNAENCGGIPGDIGFGVGGDALSAFWPAVILTAIKGVESAFWPMGHGDWLLAIGS